MKVEDLAALAVSACEEEGVAFMVTGAFACGYCGIPRSTKDVDLVLGVEDRSGIERVIARLASDVDFGAQVQFDTLTWGRRHVGHAKACPALQVELFELFDDPFVQAQFERRVMRYSGQLNRQTWLPTAEDVVVQKLRWGRNKDLDDARDVLAVQGPETLDMDYISRWCEIHGTAARLREALDGIPPL
jgi:hypothetical protein